MNTFSQQKKCYTLSELHSKTGGTSAVGAEGGSAEATSTPEERSRALLSSMAERVRRYDMSIPDEMQTLMAITMDSDAMVPVASGADCAMYSMEPWPWWIAQHSQALVFVRLCAR